MDGLRVVAAGCGGCGGRREVAGPGSRRPGGAEPSARCGGGAELGGLHLGEAGADALPVRSLPVQLAAARADEIVVLPERGPRRDPLVDLALRDGFENSA